MDLNGKAPLVDPSAVWTQSSMSEGHRTTERHRKRRRRARAASATRARIRVRIWLACTGALLFMALGMYLFLGHEGGAGQAPASEHPVYASLGLFAPVA